MYGWRYPFANMTICPFTILQIEICTRLLAVKAAAAAERYKLSLFFFFFFFFIIIIIIKVFRLYLSTHTHNYFVKWENIIATVWAHSTHFTPFDFLLLWKEEYLSTRFHSLFFPKSINIRFTPFIIERWAFIILIYI